MSDKIKYLTVADFDDQVSSSTLTLVDFWATWCGPCKMLAPVLEELAEEVSDVTVAKVDVDEEEEVALKYGIMSIPTIILFKDGKEVAKSVGYKNLSQLKAFIDQNK